MEKTLKQSAINLGTYLGLILAATTIISYAVFLELLTKWWLGILLFVVIIVFGTLSASKSKSLNGGFIEFKEAFSSYFITVAIGILISSAVSLILFNIIDPDAAIKLKEMTIEATINMMKGFNAPADAISKSVEAMEAQKNQFAIGQQLQSTAIFLVIQAVIGLIVALIVKKPKETQI
jgi:hypothetical protein